MTIYDNGVVTFCSFLFDFVTVSWFDLFNLSARHLPLVMIPKERTVFSPCYSYVFVLHFQNDFIRVVYIYSQYKK
jgi:hypothetical protein